MHKIKEEIIFLLEQKQNDYRKLINSIDKKYHEHINRNLDKITLKKLAGEKYYFNFRIRNKHLPEFSSPAAGYEILSYMEMYIRKQGHTIFDWDIIDFVNNKQSTKNKTIIKVIIEI